MLWIRRLVIGVGLFCAVSGAYAEEREGLFGRWTGVLQHETLDREQLVRLDFVTVKRTPAEWRLIGLMTVHFGDFRSSEYITYHFDSITYNLVTGALVFDQLDQDVTFVVERFTGESLEGVVRSATSGEIGRVSLHKDAPVRHSRPLISSLWGEYRGSCGGVGTRLQIQTFRSTADTTKLGNPFGAYEVQAQYAEDRPTSCMGDASSCVKWVFHQGAYDYFRGELSLVGMAKTLTCRVLDDRLTCGDCVLARDGGQEYDEEHVFPRGLPTWKVEPVRPLSVEEARIQGDYVGWVHHEYLDQYQPARLSLVTYQGASGERNSVLKVSAVGMLGFGSLSGGETISYRFKEASLGILSTQTLLENLENDVDAIVKIDSIKNGEIRGTWHSLLFGRVGTFLLSKRGVALPEGARPIEAVSGFYRGPRWVMNLSVVRESSPWNTQNPFFPLNLRGVVRLPEVTPNLAIESGTYDFYTGRISMRFSSLMSWSGNRMFSGKMLIKRVTPGSARPLVSMEPEVFELD